MYWLVIFGIFKLYIVYRIVMATQKEIDDMLQDSWCASSTLNNNPDQNRNSNITQNQHIQSQNFKSSYDEYGNEGFEDFEESRKTQNINHSQSQYQMSKKPNNPKQLGIITEEQVKQTKKQKLAQTTIDKPNKSTKYGKPALSGTDKLHLPHNYARIQQRQRELLFTSLTQQNKQLKNELNFRNNEYKKLENKYKVLLDEKVQNPTTAKEKALEKKLTAMEGRLKKAENMRKIQAEKKQYITKTSNTPHNFIPEQEMDRRESQLIQIIDKLKARIIQQDQNLEVLKKKMNEDQSYNDNLLARMKRVEQLEYRMQKMTDQAETDREYIEMLKQKSKDYQKKWRQEKDRVLKLQIEMKRMVMGHDTNKDLVEELKQVKKEKQLLEQSLRKLSANMMSKLQNSYKQAPKILELEEEGVA